MIDVGREGRILEDPRRYRMAKKLIELGADKTYETMNA
jgi:hypothetical protein